MSLLILYFGVHMFFVITQRPIQNLKSMITGWYRLGSMTESDREAQSVSRVARA